MFLELNDANVLSRSAGVMAADKTAVLIITDITAQLGGHPLEWL